MEDGGGVDPVEILYLDQVPMSLVRRCRLKRRVEFRWRKDRLLQPRRRQPANSSNGNKRVDGISKSGGEIGMKICGNRIEIESPLSIKIVL